MYVSTMPLFDRSTSYEANSLAAGLCMPESEMKKDFKNAIRILFYGDLKRKLKFSTQSLLHRIDGGFITLRQKKYLFQPFDRVEIRRRE